MSTVEIWKTFILPVIQYLVGPIVTGLSIWYLTNKRNLNETKDMKLRQKNENLVALENVINLADSIDADLVYHEQLSNEVQKMQMGDFSMLEPEFRGLSEAESINQYNVWKQDTLSSIGKKRMKMQEVFNKFKNVPKYLLPEDIHLELIRYISKDEVKLDTEKYKATLDKLKKLK